MSLVVVGVLQVMLSCSKGSCKAGLWPQSRAHTRLAAADEPSQDKAQRVQSLGTAVGWAEDEVLSLQPCSLLLGGLTGTALSGLENKAGSDAGSITPRGIPAETRDWRRGLEQKGRVPLQRGTGINHGAWRDAWREKILPWGC